MNDPKALQAIAHHTAVLAYHDTRRPDFPATSRRFAELYETLVPQRGQAPSMQGEVLRAVGRLASEDRRNGCINWNESFERLVKFLQQELAHSRIFEHEQHARIEQDLDRVMDNGRGRGLAPQMMRVVFGRLIEAAVAYCEALPDLVPKPLDPSLKI